jgi:hypothetical protein
MLDLRPEVRRFAERMEMKLRKHDADRQDGWKLMYDEDVWEGIERELAELKSVKCRCGADAEARADECADVANFLMFLASRRRAF